MKSAMACVACLSVLLAGCGEDDREGVNSAFDSVKEAVADGNALEVCEQLGPKARAQLADIGHNDQPCRSGVAPMLEQLAKRRAARSIVRGARIESVKTGNPTVATIAVAGRKVKVPFVKEDGQWKLNSFYGINPTPSVAIE